MEKKMHISLWALISGLLLTITLLAGVGVTMGRYTSTAGTAATFQARKMSHLYLSAANSEAQNLPANLLGDWETNKEYSQLRFIVSNTDTKKKVNSETVDYVLRVLVSRGSEKPNGVTISSGDEIYGGTPEAIAEGTELWNQMGAGWVYTFHPQREKDTDPLGEEIIWSMEGVESKTQEFTLIVTGESVLSTVELQLVPVISQ